MKILVGEGSCGIAAGAGKVFSALKKALPENARLEITGCIGMCWLEPIVDIYIGNKLIERLVNVSPKDASLIA
ncbi:MAG TPA: (2Fe-2S) ferredoxin domain-containing protein, partial [Clostridiales bacterium]|nr:(2Fe-2S) ferredoxin domain-containing protein [Clostridiales bacterium]